MCLILEKDPRYKFTLQSKLPNISFVLFEACNSSPPLRILHHFDKTIKEEMNALSKEYLSYSISFDQKSRTIYFPAVMGIYWKDFGEKEKSNDMIRKVTEILGNSFTLQVRQFLESLGKDNKCKIEFQKVDYTPMFIINY
jgi:hypothetical protein